jgi:AraC-like DNA-binding protein
MNIRSRLCILILAIFLNNHLFAQKEDTTDYYRIRLKYENRLENDSSALPLIRTYINKARKEKNYPQLVQGYKDAILYSVSSDDKLQYADSAIWAAKMTQDDYLIGRAYLTRGTVYYFDFKKYKLALDELLIAYDYSKKSDDPYYKNKVVYLLGVVKSYIGFYDEALVLFKQAKTFFETEAKKNVHPNLRYNNKRGYYNCLHQMAVCYRSLDNRKLADSLTDMGLGLIRPGKEFQQERGYFLKEKGIRQYYRRDYRNSIKSLKSSVAAISRVNDFAWTTVCYSYIGKSYIELDDMTTAMIYFQKVDSVFKKHNFILPEVRESYELLIDHYKEKGDLDNQLYYTTQLTKADELITHDFPYLSSKIHKEYDTQTLLDETSELQQKNLLFSWINYGLAIIALVAFVVLLVKYRKGRIFREKYKLLELKILNGNEFMGKERIIKEKGSPRLDVEQKVLDEILLKLKKFEQHHGFLESGLTVIKLAAKLDTNQTYLSLVINEYKGVNFYRYLSELRIVYITEKLYNDKKYLHYRIETLAEECGIASRNNFSDLFRDINGIRPAYFIKKRLEDISNESGAID